MKEQWQLPILILHDGRIVSIVAVPRVLNPHDKYYTVRVSGFRQLFWGGDRPKLAGGSRWRRRPPTRTPDPLRSLKLSFKPAQADGPPRRTTGSPRPRAAGEPPARRALPNNRRELQARLAMRSGCHFRGIWPSASPIRSTH